MTSRGRKPSVSNDKKLDILKKHGILEDNGNLNFNDIVLEAACKEINQLFKPDPAMTIRNLTMFATRQKQKKKTATAETTKVPISRNDKKFAPCEDEKNLILLQNNVLYKSIVREVVTKPFTLFHWPLEAVDFASSLPDDIHFLFGLTGLFCEKFTAPDGSVSEEIFLYALGVAIANEFLPVCQMSSEDTSRSLVQRFFGESLKSKLPVPPTLTLDHNYDHLIAANSVLNINMTYETYLITCLKCLSKQNDCQPRCILLTNVRLIILRLESSKSFETIKLPSVKDFFIGCIVLLSEQTNFKSFQDTLRAIFVIAYSKYPCTIFNFCFNEIHKQLKSLKIKETYNRNYVNSLTSKIGHMLLNESSFSIEYDCCMIITDVILATFIEAKSLIEECENTEMVNNDQKHAYSNLTFCNELVRLCVEFPVWTKVMNSVSSNFEKIDDFETLLHNYATTFSGCATSDTIDKCLLKNIKLNENHLLHVQQTFDKRNSNRRAIDDIERSLHGYAENWEGKNPEENCGDDDELSDSDSDLECSTESQYDVSSNPVEGSVRDIVESICKNLEHSISLTEKVPHELNSIREDSIADQLQNVSEGKDLTQTKRSTDVRRKGKYLCPDPEFEIYEEKPLKYPKKRVVIKNVIYYPPRTVSNVKQYFVTSSPLDSLIEILTSSYFDHQTFKQFVDENYSSKLQEHAALFLHLIYIYSSKFNVNSLNSERVKLLMQILDKNEIGKWTWLHEIGLLYSKIMPPSIISKLICSSCQAVVYQHYTQVKLSVDEILSGECNLSLIKLKLGNENLCACKGKLLVDAVELQTVLCYNVENNCANECSYQLNILPSTQVFDEQSFILAGAVAVQKAVVATDPPHYIAYIRSRLNDSWVWIEYNDANTIKNPKPKPVKKNLQVNLALALYIERQKKTTVNKGGSAQMNDTVGKRMNDSIPTVDHLIQHSQTSVIGNNVSTNSNSTLFEDLNSDQIASSTPKREVAPSSSTSTPQKEDSEQEDRKRSSSWSWDDPIEISIHSRSLIKNGSQLDEESHLLDNNRPGFGMIGQYVMQKCTFQLTSSFDSCFEIITSMYLDNKEFKADVDATVKCTRDVFFCVLVDYCTNFNLDNFYKERVSYLYPLVKENVCSGDGKIAYNCSMKVMDIFEEMMKSEPSYIERTVCQNEFCGNSRSEQYFSVRLSAGQFHIGTIENIQDHLSELFRDRDLTACNRCNELSSDDSYDGIFEGYGDTVQTVWDFSSYFVLDVEYVSDERNIPELLKTVPHMEEHQFQFLTAFNRLPSQLNIRGNQFCLKAVVCFSGDPAEEKDDPKKPGKRVNPSPCHYYSYVLSEDGKWIKYDDMGKDIVTTTEIPKEKLAMIFYLRTEQQLVDEFET